MYCSSPLLLNVRGAHIRADRKAGLPSPVPWGGSSCGVWAKCLHAALGASGEGFAVEGVSGVGSLRGHVALQPKLSLEPGSVTYQLCGRGRGPYLCELISTERECRFIPSFKEIHGARAMGLPWAGQRWASGDQDGPSPPSWAPSLVGETAEK